jgi:putrescine aminotransferase
MGPRTRHAEPSTSTFRRFRRHLSPRLALLYGINGANAAEATAGGAEVVLSDGRRVLDFGSYAVTLLGHRHPAVTSRVSDELDTMPTSTRVLANPTTARLAADLVDYVDPARLTRAWLGLNGCDAVELALKLARVRTGRTRVVAVQGGYHGKSLGALATTWSHRYRAGLEPLLPGCVHLPYPAGEDLVDAAFAGGDVAAVIVEPVQGEAGVRPLSAAFLRLVAERAHAAGAFVIADEIQCGLRRCGARALSVAHGMRPDAVLLGKALGGGVLPLSAVVATQELYLPLLGDPFLHSTTFSGHPLCAAAGVAALATIEEHAAHGARLAERFGAGLAELGRRHPGLVVQTRGEGLLWGIEFANPGVAGEVLADLGPRGLLVSPCLGRPEVIRVMPPIVATVEQVDHALKLLAASCSAAARALSPGAARLAGS